MDSSCYYYEEVYTERGNLDPSIDCTYVLIMHDSPRKQQIYQNVMKSHLTTNVIFQYNYGYKKCDKLLRRRGPNYDLEHAVKTIFRNALSRGYRRILVLEDDCQFDERITNEEVVKDLNSFLLEKNPSIYNLGPTFSLSSPFDILSGNKHHFLLYNNAAHAMVYNEKYMRYMLNNEFLGGHVDLETNRHFSKYTYHVPLAYQLVEKTENATYGWGSVWPLVDTFLVKPSGIDKDVQPGYDVLKSMSDYVSFVLCLFLILSIIKASFFTK